jgi:copper(I)-binding protein
MRYLLLAVALCALPAGAHNHDKGDIQVRHPWSRATAPGAKVAAGYMEIRNNGKEADRLVSAQTPVAQRVELHVTRQEGDVMRMQQVKAYDIPARERFELRPSGPHLMLVDIVRPLKKGERFPMKLRFERAGEIEVQLEVQDLGSKHPHH